MKKAIYQQLNSDKFYIMGRGSIDWGGDWMPSGDLYVYVNRRSHKTRHSYQVDMDKCHTERGYRLYIWLCLTACNSKEYTLLQASGFRTVKECTWFATEFIREYEASDHFERVVLPDLDKKAYPAFADIHGKLVHIGNTPWGVSNDIWSHIRHYDFGDLYTYYRKDFPDFVKYTALDYYDIEPGGGISHVRWHNSSTSTSYLNMEKNPELSDKIFAAYNQLKQAV